MIYSMITHKHHLLQASDRPPRTPSHDFCQKLGKGRRRIEYHSPYLLIHRMMGMILDSPKVQATDKLLGNSSASRGGTR